MNEFQTLLPLFGVYNLPKKSYNAEFSGDTNVSQSLPHSRALLLEQTSAGRLFSGSHVLNPIHHIPHPILERPENVLFQHFHTFFSADEARQNLWTCTHVLHWNYEEGFAKVCRLFSTLNLNPLAYMSADNSKHGLSRTWSRFCKQFLQLLGRFLSFKIRGSRACFFYQNPVRVD